MKPQKFVVARKDTDSNGIKRTYYLTGSYYVSKEKGTVPVMYIEKSNAIVFDTLAEAEQAIERFEIPNSVIYELSELKRHGK